MGEMMTSDTGAKYEVYSAMLDAIDAAFAEIRAKCANPHDVEEVTLHPLRDAIENMRHYKSRLHEVRQMERAALGVSAVAVNG